MSVASIIRNQIPASTKINTAAREWTQNPTSLIFKVESKRNHRASFVVTLNGADLYDVRYVVMNTQTCQFPVDVTETNVFCESLGDVIDRMFATH